MKNSAADLPLDTVHLLPVLDKLLLDLLKSLSPSEWQAQTVARLWKVKDVAAHLLDGNIRVLSMLRDGYFGETPAIHSYQDLLDFLNGLNADWVKAMKRVSPPMLILLHELTGKSYCDYYASLDPFAKAGFSVAWAGENESTNWMHIAREYTEKWLHQQQIRDAVNKPGLMTAEFFHPLMNTFIYALPHTFRDIQADEGTVIRLTIPGEAGGSWSIHYSGKSWKLGGNQKETADTEVTIDADTSWKLFSKSLRPEQVPDKYTITGNQPLGETALSMVAVMA